MKTHGRMQSPDPQATVCVPLSMQIEWWKDVGEIRYQEEVGLEFEKGGRNAHTNTPRIGKLAGMEKCGKKNVRGSADSG